MEETTSEADIEKFLKDFNQENIETTGLMDKEELLKLIRSLNSEQRKILDDLVERLMYTDYKSNPIYLYISGDAGKSLAGAALAWHSSDPAIYYHNNLFRHWEILFDTSHD